MKQIPPADVLRKLHHDDFLQLKQIAEIYDVDRVIVSRWFKKLGVPIRDGHTMKVPSKEELERVVADVGPFSRRVAKVLKVTAPTAAKWMRSHGIPLSAVGWKTHDAEPRPPLEELRECYQTMGTHMMARRYGVSSFLCYRWLKEAGVDFQNAGRRQQFESPSKEILEDMHYRQRMTIVTIAQQYGVTSSMVDTWLRDNKIKVQMNNQYVERPSKEQLEAWYLEEKLPTKIIGDRFGVERQTVVRWLHDLRIPIQLGWNRSAFEVEVAAFVGRNYSGEVLTGVNPLGCLPKNKTVDVWLPELKLAIECNGLFYHSRKLRANHAVHQAKAMELAEAGVRLLAVWEHEWKMEELRPSTEALVKDALSGGLGIPLSDGIEGDPSKVHVPAILAAGWDLDWLDPRSTWFQNGKATPQEVWDYGLVKLRKVSARLSNVSSNPKT